MACLTALDRLLVLDLTAVRSRPEWPDGAWRETWGLPTTGPPFTAELSGFGRTVRGIGAALVRAFTALTVVVTRSTSLLTTGLVCTGETAASLAAAGATTLGGQPNKQKPRASAMKTTRVPTNKKPSNATLSTNNTACIIAACIFGQIVVMGIAVVARAASAVC